MSQHHDPVHPDSDHLTPELVADLDEGLLDPTSADHAQHHLDGCSRCRELQGALTDVKADLAALSDPAVPDTRMPTDVEKRLFDVLAAASTEPSTPPAAATTVVPMATARSKRSRAWSGHGLGIAASVAAVLLVGALVVPTLMSDTGGDASDSVASAGGQASDGSSGDRINFAASKTGTKYTADDLGSQVDSLVTDVVSDPAAATADTETTSAPTTRGSDQSKQSLAMYREALDGELATNPAAAQACLEDYLGASGIQPLAIDIGTFVDPNEKVIKPAAVIVLPIDEDPVQAEVWIVDPECSGAESVTLYWAKVNLPR